MSTDKTKADSDPVFLMYSELPFHIKNDVSGKAPVGRSAAHRGSEKPPGRARPLRIERSPAPADQGLPGQPATELFVLLLWRTRLLRVWYTQLLSSRRLCP